MIKYCVYIVKCHDNYLYTGITGNINKRIREHQEGKCRFTKGRGKIKTVYLEHFSSRIDAAKREKTIKGWSRVKKESLISKFTLRSDSKERRNGEG